MGSLSLIIMGLTLAARYEPVIAAVLGVLIPALKQLHESHGDAVLLGDIDRLLHSHGISSGMAAKALRQVPTPEGNPDAFKAGSDSANI